MHMSEYESVVAQTAIYPGQGTPPGLLYATLGAAGESGEIANKVKKLLRGDRTLDGMRENLIAEVGDVLWYVCALARELGTTLDDVAQKNADKLLDRQDRGQLQGDGDNR